MQSSSPKAPRAQPLSRFPPNSLPLALLVLSALTTALQAQPLANDRNPPPTLTFSERAVTVAPAQAGKVVWFGVAREYYNHGVTVANYQGIGEAKAGEAISIELPQGLSPAAIWAAVDLTTGATTVLKPDGSLVDVTELRGNPRSGLRKLDLQTYYAQILWVRPGLGAWTVRAGDGGSLDDDGESNGRLGALLERMEPLGASPAPPERIERKDVIVVINPHNFETLASTVAEVQE